MVLTALVILSVVRQFFLGNYHNMFLGILTLILFMVPQFLDRKLSVTIPPGLETVILIFIFSAEILGEINAFYVKIPIWDTILHTTNGFLMAAIGFALIDLFNRSDRFSIKMSPYFVAFSCNRMDTGNPSVCKWYWTCNPFFIQRKERNRSMYSRCSGRTCRYYLIIQRHSAVHHRRNGCLSGWCNHSDLWYFPDCRRRKGI